MAKVALLGHGVVGSGVAELLEMNRDSIHKKAAQEIDIKYILDLRDFGGLSYSHKFTKDFNDIMGDDEISVIIEVMGGLHPAYEFVKESLSRRKSVVTSNKELVAEKGAELLAIAKENNVNFFFEASVGGGIPIIHPMHMCLAANRITEIAGILNGTTNFILTKMIREHMPFDTALSLAQELGYAERNPAADVEGTDACRKICILASLAFGKHVHPSSVYTEGITKITLEDVEYADNWGGVIKLIGCAKLLDDNREFVIVSPAFIKKDSQLANIDDVFNGILVRGDATGDVVFYGKGAGKLPTASAVISDVIDCVKHPTTRMSLSWVDTNEEVIRSHKEIPIGFYVRCIGQGGSEEKSGISEAFGSVRFLARSNAPSTEIAFVTEPITENDLTAKLNLLPDLTMQSCIRLMDY